MENFWGILIIQELNKDKSTVGGRGVDLQRRRGWFKGTMGKTWTESMKNGNIYGYRLKEFVEHTRNLNIIIS